MNFLEEVKQRTEEKTKIKEMNENFQSALNLSLKVYKEKILNMADLGFNEAYLEFSGINLQFYFLIINYFKDEGFTISEETTKRSQPLVTSKYLQPEIIKEVKISW